MDPFTGSLTKWVECSPMVRETWVQSQVDSFQRLKKWYLRPPCFTFRIIRYISKVKWNNPGKGVTPSSTPRCCSYWKRGHRVALDFSHQLLHLWTLSHGRAVVGRSARTPLQQLCTDAWCSLEDLQEEIDDRYEWRERASGKSVLAVRYDDADGTVFLSFIFL